MALMQQRPELFWNRNKSNQTAASASAAAASTVSKPMLILEPTQEEQEKEARPLGLQVDTELWSTVETLLKKKLSVHNKNGKDNMDVDDENKETSSFVDLKRIQSCLEGIVQDLLVQQQAADMDVEEDETSTRATSSPENVANTLVQATAKDLLQVLKVMLEDSSDTAATTTKGDNSPPKNDTGASATDPSNDNSTDDKDFITKEAWLLLCSEEFPQEKVVAKDDTIESLASRTAAFTKTGNSNDPLVHNLICNEKGFFEGDNAEVLEEGEVIGPVNVDDDGQQEVVRQRLLLIQETTHIIRAKTLQLARRRLQRQQQR